MNSTLEQYYISAEPIYTGYLMCYYFSKCYPKVGTVNFFRFMSLLRYLEMSDHFSLQELQEFREEQ